MGHSAWSTRFGGMVVASVNLIPESPIADIVELAVRAESLGFERCWVYDEGLAARDVHITMTAIGAATERLAIGPGITNPHSRHPAQTAAAIATLDEMTGGRAFLGLGAGGSLTLAPLGIEPHRPLAALRETISACRSLFSGEVIDLEGDHITLRSAKLHYGRADLEIWVAGRGPRVLGLGGELADGVLLDFLHVDVIADAIDLIRRGAVEGADTPRIAYSTSIVTDEDDLEFVRPHMTYRLLDAPPAVKELIGLTDADVATIGSAMAGGIEAAAEHVRDEWILPFVVTGSVAECSATIANLVARHDIEEFVLPMFDMAEPTAYLERVAVVLEGV
jgi:5,10-methylenetetrahydromethanopterin reductase